MATYSIKNWDRFQHYTKRHPPWVKLYHDLLDDNDFAGLSEFAQLLYFKLLMAGSRKDNRIPTDPAWMAAELSLPKSRVQKGVKELLSTGFLACTSASNPASRPASTSASNGASGSASPSRAPAHSRETEVEREIDPKAVALSAVIAETRDPSDEPKADHDRTALDHFLETVDLREIP